MYIPLKHKPPFPLENVHYNYGLSIIFLKSEYKYKTKHKSKAHSTSTSNQDGIIGNRFTLSPETKRKKTDKNMKQPFLSYGTSGREGD